jgi:hypothetical protein
LKKLIILAVLALVILGCGKNPLFSELQSAAANNITGFDYSQLISGTLVWSDDFEGYPAGDFTAITGPWTFWDVPTGSVTFSIASFGYTGTKGFKIGGDSSSFYCAAEVYLAKSASKAVFAYDFYYATNFSVTNILMPDMNYNWLVVLDGHELKRNGKTIATLQANTWYHYLVTYDRPNNVSRYYVNNTLVNTDTCNSSLSTLCVGGVGPGSIYYLDNIQVYQN